MSITELKRNLQDEVKILTKQIAYAQAQLADTINESDKPALDAQIERLSSEWHEKHSMLKRLELGIRDPNDVDQLLDQIWKTESCKIDSQKAFEQFREVMENHFKRDHGAALFLIENCAQMHVEGFLTRINQWLRNDEFFKTFDIDVLPDSKITIDLTDNNAVDIVINRMRKRLNLSDTCEQGKCIEQIIDKLHNLIRRQSIVIIDIEIQSRQPNSFYQWFLNDFWLPLVTQMPSISAQKKLIGVVVFVYAHQPLFQELIPDNLCCGSSTIEHFEKSKYFPIEMTDWEITDVLQWFEVHSRLVTYGERYQISDLILKQWCDEIFNSFQGNPVKPSLIYSYLETVFHKKRAYIVERMRDELASVQILR